LIGGPWALFVCEDIRRTIGEERRRRKFEKLVTQL
jgi:hypothetical protein